MSILQVSAMTMPVDQSPKSPGESADEPASPEPTPARALSPAAQRALAEAQARRDEIDARARDASRDREVNGRGGLEPVRYTDWEVKGIASDF